MKRSWWKFLAVLLVLTASIAALRVPLAPGLVHASAVRMNAGENTTTLMGYATHFTTEPAEVWLENGGEFVKADHVEVIDDLHLNVHFNVPAGMREDMCDAIVTSARVGALRLTDAFFYADKGTGAIEGTTTFPEQAHSTAYVFPNRAILNESIRNLNFHVPMWFTMMMLQTISLVFSIKVLRSN
ncbi:MAG TPA: hypothetical protein PK760_13515, partial [Flavobacteriales bacterium]|nr:hypothetical protein [Flavobacteriales bacterium]